MTVGHIRRLTGETLQMVELTAPCDSRTAHADVLQAAADWCREHRPLSVFLSGISLADSVDEYVLYLMAGVDPPDEDMDEVAASGAGLRSFVDGSEITIMGDGDPDSCSDEDVWLAAYVSDPHQLSFVVPDSRVDWVRSDGTVVGGVWAGQRCAW